MFFDWFQDDDPERPPLAALKLEGFSGIIVSPEGVIAHIDASGYPMEIDAPFYALGIGADIDIGALEMGATSQEAVKAAIKWSANCGGKIQVVKL